MARQKTPLELKNELYSKFVVFAKRMCLTAAMTNANSSLDRISDQRYLKLTWIIAQALPDIVQGNEDDFKIRISKNPRFSCLGHPVPTAVMWLEMLEGLATETETKKEVHGILTKSPSSPAALLANLSDWVSQARLQSEEAVVAFVHTYPKEFKIDKDGIVSSNFLANQSLDNSILNLLKLANPTDENSRTKNIPGTSQGKLFFKVGWVRKRLPHQANAGPMTSKSILIEYLKSNPKFLINQDCVHSAEISRLMPTEQALEAEVLKIMQQRGEMTLSQVLTFLQPHSKLRIRNEYQLRHFLKNKSYAFTLDGSLLRLALNIADSGVAAAEVRVTTEGTFDVENVANLGSYATEVMTVLEEFRFGISTAKLWPRLSRKLKTAFVRHKNLLCLTQKFPQTIKAKNSKMYLVSQKPFTKIKKMKSAAAPLKQEGNLVGGKDDAMTKKLLQGHAPRSTAYTCHYLQHVTSDLVILSLRSDGKALLHRQFLSSQEVTEENVLKEESFMLASSTYAIVTELAQPVHDIRFLVMHAWHGKKRITTPSSFDSLSLTLSAWIKFVEKSRDNFMEKAQSGLGLLKVGVSPHFALSKALRLLVTKVSSKEFDSFSGIELALCKLYRELFTMDMDEGRKIVAASFTYKDPLFESALLKLLLPAPLSPPLYRCPEVSLPKTKCVDILVTEEGDLVIRGLTGYIWKVRSERRLGLLLVVAADTQYLVQFSLDSQLQVGDKVLFTLRAMEGVNNTVIVSVEDLAVMPTTDRTRFLAFLRAEGGEDTATSFREKESDTLEDDLAPLGEEEEEDGEAVITLPMFESSSSIAVEGTLEEEEAAEFGIPKKEKEKKRKKEKECLLS